MGQIIWFIIALLVIVALFPNLGIANGLTYPRYAAPSIWTLILILIILRVFGIL